MPIFFFLAQALRHSELWSQYRFICSCQRCSISPPSYVDHTLQVRVPWIIISDVTCILVTRVAVPQFCSSCFLPIFLSHLYTLVFTVQMSLSCWTFAYFLPYSSLPLNLYLCIMHHSSILFLLVIFCNNWAFLSKHDLCQLWFFSVSWIKLKNIFIFL